MSNPNRPFGDTDPFDTNDPHQDARTDAPPSDADALDAWLNGIASHSGSPSTRSGSSQRRPDARIDDHDVTGEAASLIETAIRFHRRIDEAQSRDARAAEPDPQLWETIMARTAASSAPTPSATQAATANPWVAHRDTLHPAPTRAKRTSRPRRSHQQRIWSTLANLALVLAILLAGFGVWRLSDGLGLPPASNDNTPTVPGFAMKASPPAESPATNEPNEVIVPPVATPAPTTDCDFSEDIPIFNGVDESPWDGTAVLLTTAGEVVLSCPEEPEGTVLMQTSPHGTVVPLEWPGVVLIPSYGEKPEEARTRV
ncbi:MAG TPA: hypothetical protein VD789_02135, partial [Thermomicrobiales bacterium]|nr:hypothetical protein [Thermomicrobiales bacterium]